MENPVAKSSSKKTRFEESCVRKLTSFPTAICPEGLKRVQWEQANIGYTAKDERTAPGCPFGVLTEDKHSYCTFKLMAMSNEGMSYREIAKRTGLTVEQVERIEKAALQKLKSSGVVAELLSIHKQTGIFDEPNSANDTDGDLYFDYADFSAESLMELGSEEYLPK